MIVVESIDQANELKSILHRGNHKKRFMLVENVTESSQGAHGTTRIKRLPHGLRPMVERSG